MFDFTNSSTIYISATEGSDAYTGFAPHPEKGGAGPLRSFRRLRELLVGMHTVGHIQPITVRIEGEHYFTETYTLGSISGGYVMRDITFEGTFDVSIVFRKSLLPLTSKVETCPLQLAECEDLSNSSFFPRASYMTESSW